MEKELENKSLELKNKVKDNLPEMQAKKASKMTEDPIVLKTTKVNLGRLGCKILKEGKTLTQCGVPVEEGIVRSLAAIGAIDVKFKGD